MHGAHCSRGGDTHFGCGRPSAACRAESGCRCELGGLRERSHPFLRGAALAESANSPRSAFCHAPRMNQRTLISRRLKSRVDCHSERREQVGTALKDWPATYWPTALVDQALCSLSTTLLAQKCNPCLRYDLSLMSPGRTYEKWSGRKDLNIRPPGPEPMD